MAQANKNGWKPKPIHSVEDLRAELNSIEGAHQAGNLSTTGEWSAAQNLEHCAINMRNAFDGFDFTAPLHMRLMGKFFKGMMTKPGAQMKPGYKIPKSMTSLMPQDNASFEDGFGLMNAQVARLEAGEKMTQRSPFLGALTPEQWVGVHLNHCRMHFGFIKTD